MHAHERAAQIWSLLTYAASHRQTITYDLLSRHIGVPRHGLGQLLEPVQSYCLIHELPALTSLVVTENGQPGPGFVAVPLEDVPAEQQGVFAHDWLAQWPPSEDILRDAAIERPSNGIRAAVEAMEV
jgi:hypothetical protein